MMNKIAVLYVLGLLLFGASSLATKTTNKGQDSYSMVCCIFSFSMIWTTWKIIKLRMNMMKKLRLREKKITKTKTK